MGHLARKFCRRVVTDIDSGRKVCDETIHHKSGIAYLRRELPEEICNKDLTIIAYLLGIVATKILLDPNPTIRGVKALLPAVLALFVLLLACTPGGLKRSERKVSR